jgi:hypothetical protein
MAKKSRKPEPGKEIFRGTDIGKQTDRKIPRLETSIDRLYHLVKQRKSINFYDAASEYGVDKEQIATWAHILEEHKLAKVHYPVFGSPEIFSIEEDKKKKTEEGEEEKERKPGKGFPKIMVALIGGLMVLSGYVMLVSNPFTITVRSQVTVAAGRFSVLFSFLPYPLNIITPAIIVIAAAGLVLWLRHRSESHKARPQKEETEKSPKEKGKRPKDIEGKIDKIKEELGY